MSSILIEILLVLLVIFLTISPITPSGLSAEIPQPAPAQADRPPDEGMIIMTMDWNGAIRINQDEVQPAELVARLHDIFKTRRNRTVFVQADNELLFSDVAQLIDAPKGVGWSASLC